MVGNTIEVALRTPLKYTYGRALRAPAMVLPKEESLEKVYFDFLSIICFFRLKKETIGPIYPILKGIK